eukprot:873756-Pelagomonas_calceolata.AAC.3
MLRVHAGGYAGVPQMHDRGEVTKYTHDGIGFLLSSKARRYPFCRQFHDAHQGSTLAHEAVEQGGLAHVWAPHQCNLSVHAVSSQEWKGQERSFQGNADS